MFDDDDDDDDNNNNNYNYNNNNNNAVCFYPIVDAVVCPVTKELPKTCIRACPCKLLPLHREKLSSRIESD